MGSDNAISAPTHASSPLGAPLFPEKSRHQEARRRHPAEKALPSLFADLV